MEQIFKILPHHITDIINIYISNIEKITEIRIRINKCIYVYLGLVEKKIEYISTYQDIMTVIKNVSMNSIYSVQQDINAGYILVNGGHRIGLVGDVVYVDGKIKNIKNISSLNIRIAKQIIGVADKVINYIYDNNEIKNTLIVSPPGMGKTTILRDVIRKISNLGKNVSVIDERGELSAKCNGVPMLDLGDRTDVISYVSKKDGYIMALRSMAPDVICTDEIGSSSDIDVIKEISRCGVKFIVTMHASSVKDIYSSDISKIISNKYLDRIIILSKKCGIGTIEEVIKLN